MIISAPVRSSELARDIGAKLKDTWAARGQGKWLSMPGLHFAVLVTVLVLLTLYLPNRIYDPEVRRITFVIGGLALWRFGWWFTHALRSEIYLKRVWPKMRAAADACWNEGWRPRRVHFLIVTYYEQAEVTEAALRAILREIRISGVEATIWIGTGAAFDERVIRAFVAREGADISGRLVFVRQNQPGKRMAIGLLMRAIMRSGARKDDLIFFMDGDAVLEEGALAKTVSLFGADPELQALTTDEEVIVYGPRWMSNWLKMRFAQRRIAMQSHALSKKVLTLTGRMSVFRGLHTLNLSFVRTVEADQLEHWLWGRFRFLSGDDKSTWYHLLQCGAKMTYVPDTQVITIERIEGNAWARMVANLRRWSGNMLRNGARAIALGPRHVGPFIWWCLVDQRLAMWTMMISPILVFYGTLMEPTYFAAALIWIAITRSVLSFFLFRYSPEVNVSWPALLYINQLLNASVKIFMITRLAQQTWANRGNQKAGHGQGGWDRARFLVANLQLLTMVAALAWALGIVSGYLRFDAAF